jgi:deoxyuridine 5'-triphosphate nucleotidohydrolase
MILNYTKVRSDVVTPTRANPSDAGLDLYYCPEQRDKQILLIPGETALFPTGIKLEIPHGYYFEIKNRSGVAYKSQLLVGACVVDSGYDGEIFVNLHNVGRSGQWIKPGTKIAQGMGHWGAQMDKNTQKTMFSSKTNEWSTPDDFYQKLNQRFGPFSLDPCSDGMNNKTEKFFTPEENGLEQDWGGNNVFMNPPYGREIGKWIKKAYEEG